VTNGNPGQSSGGTGGTGGGDGGDWIYSSVNISRGGRGWNTSNPNGLVGQNGVSAMTQTTSGTYGLGGGGGSVGSGYCNCGGGGGGYSGGGAGNINTSGGGGGSFNGGTSQLNTAGANTGDGLVIITYQQDQVVQSVSSTTVCLGSSVTLSATGVPSYTWSNGSNSNQITFFPSTTTNVVVAGTSTSGCVSSKTISVLVNPAVPSLTVSGTTSVCVGRSTTLTATGALTYTWSNGAPNGGTFAPTATTVYTVTGGNACGTSSLAVTVTASPIPVATAANPTVVCAFKPTVLSAVAAASCCGCKQFYLAARQQSFWLQRNCKSWCEYNLYRYSI
jgi:hypothetical protein